MHFVTIGVIAVYLLVSAAMVRRLLCSYAISVSKLTDETVNLYTRSMDSVQTA